MKNKNRYWEQREASALEARLKQEKGYSKKVENIYNDMMDACQSEIDRFYRKYADAEGITIAEAKRRVKKLDIEEYQRKAARYVETKDFTDTANKEMRIYNTTMRINRLEMLKARLGLELAAGHSDLEKMTGEILEDRTDDELRRQAGILGDTVRDNTMAVKSIVNGSFHNATFSQRIWLHQSLLKSELDKLLQSGLVQGKNPRDLASDLRKSFAVSRQNAERLMRTELARVQTEAQKESFRRMGFEEYTFHANSSCCDDCQALNGKHFKIKDMMPGENASPLHPNCRCSCSAYEDSEDYEAWLDFLSKGGTTEEWKRKNKNNVNKTTKEFVKKGKKDEEKVYREQINGLDEEYKELTKEEFKKMTHKISKEERKIIYGRGHFSGYINSSNARKINKVLREKADPLKFLSENHKEIVTTIDEVIRRCVLPENIKTTRYVDGDALKPMFGIDMPTGSITESSESFFRRLEMLIERLENGIIYQEKGFLSTSGVDEKNVFTDRPIKMLLYAKKGTNAYITTNYRESEIIFGRNSRLILKKAYIENPGETGWKLVLECEVY